MCQNSLNVGTCLWHVYPNRWFSGLTSQSDVPTSLNSRNLTHPLTIKTVAKTLGDSANLVHFFGFAGLAAGRCSVILLRVGDFAVEALAEEMHFIIESNLSSNTNLNGKSFCITGSLSYYANRDALINAIEDNGGKYISSVSKKIDYLINNDKTSTSGKNKKAIDLNIPIISEKDFISMIGGHITK